jgi:hypothetical protein
MNTDDDATNEFFIDITDQIAVKITKTDFLNVVDTLKVYSKEELSTALNAIQENILGVQPRLEDIYNSQGEEWANFCYDVLLYHATSHVYSQFDSSKGRD